MATIQCCIDLFFALLTRAKLARKLPFETTKDFTSATEDAVVMDENRRFTLSELCNEDDEAELLLLLDKLLPCACFWQSEKLNCDTTASRIISTLMRYLLDTTHG